jgi:KUP system potassium uptake protein
MTPPAASTVTAGSAGAAGPPTQRVPRAARTQVASQHHLHDGHHHGTNKWALMFGALGVVYGDIGTSPLYALKECFSPASPHHVAPSPANVLGVLSLVFWSLSMVIIVKYLSFVLRADNDGEGGILALLALVPGKDGRGASGPIVVVVLFGAALLFGDGVITPAISVLGAMEGLAVKTPALKHFVLPLTCGVLLALFLVQKRGTGGVAKIFGPATLLWFLTIGALGARALVAHPEVLGAIDPRHAVHFFVQNRGHGFLVLGSVVLCITGCEALYADMGHFGREPIRRAWYLIVFPALLLNYFGQGAHLLTHPGDADNPFYALAPDWAVYPVVAIATVAAAIAAQALISGAFSLTQQAVQLGFFPRVTIIHTSKETEGQIYIPEVNNGLLVACLCCVLMFRSSTALATAYGIAVTGTMTITSIVYYVVVTRAWGWSRWKALPLVGLFLLFDLPFLGANGLKFLDGGWFPVAIAAVIFTVMTTWKAGRKHLAIAIKSALLPLRDFLDDVAEVKPHRVRGTAVFMASNIDGTPPVLLHHFKHNQVLHEQVVLLSVQSLRVPEVLPERRLDVKSLGQGFFQVVARTGFMETPNVPRMLEMCKSHGLVIDLPRTSYYLGRETLLTSGKSHMWRWRKGLFAFISRNARPATAYFGLPPNRVVELGMQIDL